MRQRRDLNPGDIGRRQVLSPLRHNCPRPRQKVYQAILSQHPKFIFIESNSLRFKVVIFTAAQ